MWTLEEIAVDLMEWHTLDEITLKTVAPVQSKKRGRPQGAKDTVKRQRRTICLHENPMESEENDENDSDVQGDPSLLFPQSSVLLNFRSGCFTT